MKYLTRSPIVVVEEDSYVREKILSVLDKAMCSEHIYGFKDAKDFFDATEPDLRNTKYSMVCSWDDLFKRIVDK